MFKRERRRGKRLPVVQDTSQVLPDGIQLRVAPWHMFGEQFTAQLGSVHVIVIPTCVCAEGAGCGPCICLLRGYFVPSQEVGHVNV